MPITVGCVNYRDAMKSTFFVDVKEVVIVDLPDSDRLSMTKEELYLFLTEAVVNQLVVKVHENLKDKTL